MYLSGAVLMAANFFLTIRSAAVVAANAAPQAAK
jgi:hypothetical protein